MLEGIRKRLAALFHILRIQCKRAGLDPEMLVSSDASVDETFDRTVRELERMERALRD